MLKIEKIIITIFISVLISTPNYSQTKLNDKFSGRLILEGNQKTASQDWNWKFIGAPLGETKVGGILVDPENDNTWYVSSLDSGLYITRDGGNSWEHPLPGRGLDIEGYQIDPHNPSRLLVTVWDKLYISNDKGITWQNTYTCPEYIRSILISKIDSSIYIAPQTEQNNTPGIYKSTDGGVTFTHLQFGVSTNWVICWDIEEDPNTGFIYIGVELADHPQPYNPPFFRSIDGGNSWGDISGDLPWHGLKIQIDPASSKIYYLVERGGLYESSNYGNGWQLTSYFYGFYLLLDKNNPGYLYGADSPQYQDGGGAHLSIDGGKTFKRIGLDTLNVSSVALNNSSDRLYAACYGSGIWIADIPEIIDNRVRLVTNTNDSGEGSLRNAIDFANTNAGADTIKFNIPKSDPNFEAGKGIWVIKPGSALPGISDSNLVIDGTSQRLFIDEDTNPEGPEIVIDGSNAGEHASGLTTYAEGTEVYGLTINRFGSTGIIFYQSGLGIVSGCYIGTDYTGMEAAGNKFGIGLWYKVRGVHIGPSEYAFPNVISGSTQTGIFLADSSNQNIIVGNFIGVNRDVTDTISNYLRGIDLERSCDSNYIFDNYIGGNGVGITIIKSNSNIVSNNFIGTNETWGSDFGNGTGIHLWSNSSNNKIIENIIGYNWSGIRVDSSNSVRNIISRNLISKNSGLGIDNRYGGNTELTPPAIISFTNNQISGTAGVNQVIEIFADSSDEGQIYIDSTVTDAGGNFTLSVSTLPDEFPNITATARDTDGNTSEYSSPFVVTDIENEKNKIPTEYALYQNYPNPFNPTTTIKYSIPTVETRHALSVQLKIYDVLGKEVATLVDQKQASGNYEVNFDASSLPSGIYLYRLQVSGAGNYKEFIQTKKMTILK